MTHEYRLNQFNRIICVKPAPTFVVVVASRDQDQSFEQDYGNLHAPGPADRQSVFDRTFEFGRAVS